MPPQKTAARTEQQIIPLPRLEGRQSAALLISSTRKSWVQRSRQTAKLVLSYLYTVTNKLGESRTANGRRGRCKQQSEPTEDQVSCQHKHLNFNTFFSLNVEVHKLNIQFDLRECQDVKYFFFVDG